MDLLRWLSATALLTIVAPLPLTGCGSGDDGSGVSGSTTLRGVAADEPLSGAMVTVYGIGNPRVLGVTETGPHGQFSVEVPDREEYRLATQGGTFSNGQEFQGKLEAYCESAGEVCSITPMSSLAVHLKGSRDLTVANAQRAAKSAMGLADSHPDPFLAEALADQEVRQALASKLPAGIPGPLKEQIDHAVERAGDVQEDYADLPDEVAQGVANGTDFTTAFTPKVTSAQQAIREKGLAAWLDKRSELAPTAYEGRLSGTVEVHNPVSHATVSLIRHGEKQVIATTDSNGHWESRHKIELLGPFTIEVTGGYIIPGANEEYSGTLEAHFYSGSNEDKGRQPDWDDLRVNAVTTLAARYQSPGSHNHAIASGRVKDYFDIPQDVSLASPELADHFSHDVFLDQTGTRSGQSQGATTSQLQGAVSQERATALSSNGHDIFRSNLEQHQARLEAGANSAGGYAYKAASAIGTGALGQMGAMAFSAAMGQVLPAMGVENPKQKTQDKLNDIQNSLKNLDSKLSDFEEKTTEKFAELKKDLDEQDVTIISQSIQEHLNDINNIYSNNFKQFVARDKEVDVVSLKAFYERSKNVDLEGSASKIHKQIYTTPDSEQTPSIKALTKVLENKILEAPYNSRGETLQNSYKQLQHYFLHNVLSFWRGSEMVLNYKLLYRKIANYQAEHPDKSLAGALEALFEEDGFNINLNEMHDSHDDYVKKFHQRLEKQADIYIQMVERLVAASADTRTRMLNPTAMFDISAVRDVLKEADLLAHQLKNGSESRFITRVVGDPLLLEKFGDNKGSQPEEWSYPDGFGPTSGPGDPKWISVADSESAVRKYPNKEWIGGSRFLSVPYLGWLPGDVHTGNDRILRFQTVSDIAFTKFYYPGLQADLEDEAELQEGQDGAVGAYNHLEPIRYVRGLETTEISVEITGPSDETRGTGDDEAFVFGHALVVARQAPEIVHRVAYTHGQAGDILKDTWAEIQSGHKFAAKIAVDEPGLMDSKIGEFYATSGFDTSKLEPMGSGGRLGVVAKGDTGNNQNEKGFTNLSINKSQSWDIEEKRSGRRLVLSEGSWESHSNSRFQEKGPRPSTEETESATSEWSSPGVRQFQFQINAYGEIGADVEKVTWLEHYFDLNGFCLHPPASNLEKAGLQWDGNKEAHPCGGLETR